MVGSLCNAVRPASAAGVCVYCCRAVGMRRSKSQRRVLSGRVRRVAATFAVLALAFPLAGCLITGEEIAAAINIPTRYREAPRNPDRALPHVLWWRGFRSK